MSNEITIDNKYLVLVNGKENREGEGVSSIVYKVEDMKTKEVYAAKVLTKEEYRNSFDNEKEFLTFLKEKGIESVVNIIDSGDGNIKAGNISIKRKYLILEYAEKKDLTRYISQNLMNNGFSKPHAQLLFSKILKAIKAIHESGVCHRDIKTDNILLDNEFNPKICDFGFSTYINNTAKIMCGTYPYAAPEILIIQKDAPKYAVSRKYIKGFDGDIADVFALGVTLFNIVAGKRCFDLPTKLDKSYKYIINHDYDKFWKLKNIEPEPSDEFKDLFVKMVDTDPEKRIKINEIENCKWLKDYENKSNDEKKKNRNRII